MAMVCKRLQGLDHQPSVLLRLPPYTFELAEGCFLTEPTSAVSAECVQRIDTKKYVCQHYAVSRYQSALQDIGGVRRRTRHT